MTRLAGLARVGERAVSEQTGAVLERFRPTTPLGRAVLPVVGGIAFFALLFGATWGIAALMSNNPGSVSERLAPTTFDVGGEKATADIITTHGPVVFRGLIVGSHQRSFVLDDDPTTKLFNIHLAYPADRTDVCTLKVVKGTRTFTDCEGHTVTVDDLALPPQGVRPKVEAGELFLNLKPDTPATSTPATSTPAGVTTTTG